VTSKQIVGLINELMESFRKAASILLYIKIIHNMNTYPILYKRFSPSHALRNYIDYFWAVDAPGPKYAQQEMFISSGQSSLLISGITSSVLIDPALKTRIPTTNTIVGITTKPYILKQFAIDRVRCIGAQFTPFGLAAFIPKTKLINKTMTLAEWLGNAEAKKLLAILLPLKFDPKPIKLLDDYLQAKLHPINVIDVQALKMTIQYIKNNGGQVVIEKITKELQIEYISLYRLFMRYIGISPKQFADSIRFYNFTGDLLKDSTKDPAVFIALMHGYYDQSHASKDFKKFTGISPNTFKEMTNTLAHFMHQD